MQTKICKCCGIEKPLKEFTPAKANKDGYQNRCKKCRNEGKKISNSKYKNNFIERKEKQCKDCKTIKAIDEFPISKTCNDGHMNSCKVCHNKYNKQWRKNNQEHHNKYNKQWHKNNEQYPKNWRESNKEKITTYRQKRRAKEKALLDNLTSYQWQQTLRHFDYKCPLTDDTNIHLEHFIPVSLLHSGTVKGNCYPISASLNCSKSNSNPFLWILNQPKDIQEKFYNELVPYLANLNNMSVAEFKAFTFWCFDNPRTIEEVEKDHEFGITSIVKFRKEELQFAV